MKKFTIIVLTILVMVSMAAAQVDGTQVIPTAPANSTFYGVDQTSGHTPGTPGGHISHGCMLCHAPHSANAVSITTTATKIGPGMLDSSWTGAPPASVNTGNSGNAIAGSLYLWGAALTAQSYTTWDGATNIISAASITQGKNSAVVHTLLCMSCHDDANSTYAMGSVKTPANTMKPEFGVTNTVTDAYGDNIGLSTIGGGPSGPAIMNGSSSLANSHPVHDVYTSGSHNWLLGANFADGSASFVDTSFQMTATASGHPAKLWVDGGASGTVAYVECTSCHDPHRETAYAYWNGTGYTVGGANSTLFYLRGPYTDPTKGNGNTNANFCRSCHYSKSAAYAVAGGKAQ